MLPFEVDAQQFTLCQYTDSETYGQAGQDGDLSEFMRTTAGYLPDLLENYRDEAYKRRARSALIDFGRFGRNYSAIWLITVLENRSLN